MSISGGQTIARENARITVQNKTAPERLPALIRGLTLRNRERGGLLS